MPVVSPSLADLVPPLLREPQLCTAHALKEAIKLQKWNYIKLKSEVKVMLV
jgi:hypothetical protein